MKKILVVADEIGERRISEQLGTTVDRILQELGSDELGSVVKRSNYKNMELNIRRNPDLYDSVILVMPPYRYVNLISFVREHQKKAEVRVYATPRFMANHKKEIEAAHAVSIEVYQPADIIIDAAVEG
ncbi:MAG: hypothetical protein HY514_04540 [Candidatus Aenigmarchaeota archaeon]|nr:hypothetical protein [Candidatus Aenigmarchaeota archaeon]